VNSAHHFWIFIELDRAAETREMSGERFEGGAVAFWVLESIAVDGCAMDAKTE